MNAVTRLTLHAGLVLCCACSSAVEEQTAVARVGDRILSEQDLETSLPLTLSSDVEAAERAAFIENWIREELLYQEALERELDRDPRIEELLEQTRRDLLVAALLDREFDGQEVALEEAEIQAYYDAHQEEFVRERSQVRVRHILVGSQRDANSARQALERGETFAEVALAYSLDGDTRDTGGDLGYFYAEERPALWEACRNLELNETSKPVQTAAGFHLIEVLDRQEPGSYLTLGQVRQGIVEVLVRSRYRSRLDDFVGRLKSKREWVLYAPQTEPSSEGNAK